MGDYMEDEPEPYVGPRGGLAPWSKRRPHTKKRTCARCGYKWHPAVQDTECPRCGKRW